MRRILIIVGAMFIASIASAQLHFGISLNLNSQPAWGPTGYDRVEYYYLPDIEVYYNVPQHRYYYNERGRWINSASLPSRFHNFDLYHSYKVVVNEPTPYRNHAIYREKYSSFRGRHDQQVIRDSRESKYYANVNHPEHNTWVKQQRHDNGNGKGVGNNKGNGNGNGKEKGRDKNNGRD
jgi:hypothetical protein